jgi:hypothetical protein
MDSVAVPFSYDYMRSQDYTSIAVQGVLRTEHAGLVLEFQERLVVANSGKKVDTSVRRVVVPWSEVQSVAVIQPWLKRPRLVVRTRGLLALQGLPNVEGIEARLPVARADRGLAYEAAGNIEAAIAEHRLRRLEDAGSGPPLPPY